MNFSHRHRFYVGVLASVIGLMLSATLPPVDAQGNRNAKKGIDAISDVKELPSNEKRWALIIGINQYEASKSISPLIGAENDANALRNALRDYAGFPENQIVLMTTDQKEDSLKPRRQNILRQLAKITTNVGDDGLFLFGFSGHGISTPDGQAFLLPSDADMINSLTYLVDNAVAVKRIQDYINASHTKQVIVLLDACRNVPRQGAKGMEATPMTDGFRFNQLNKDVKVAVTIYATETGKFAWEHMTTKRGYFMEAVVDGLSGQAADKKSGDVTLNSLVTYVEETVRSNTAREDSQQVPWSEMSGNSQRLVIAKTKVSYKVPFSIRANPLIIDAKVIIKAEGKPVREGMTANGEWIVELEQGNYDFEVSADKYKTQTRRVSVNAGGRTSETFSLAPKTGSIRIFLSGIGPEDKNLRVFLDDTPRVFAKLTDTIALFDIDEGPHRLRVEHPNIVDSGKELAINLKGGEDVNRVVIAKPADTIPPPVSSMGAFSLVANVSSARVVIRSEDKSSREDEIRNGEFHTDLPPGTYDVEVAAEKYKPRPWKKQITIQRGKSLLEAVSLVSEIGSIVVDLGSIAPDDKNLRVSIDGKPAGFIKRPDNRIEIAEIQEGSHQLRVEHPSATPLNERAVLQGGGVMNYRIYPKPSEPPPLTTGTLSIGVNIPTARVVIKSKTKGLIGEKIATTDLRFELPPDSYEVEVKADRYRVWTQTVLLSLGDVKTLPVTLEPDLVTVTVRGPAGASVYLDKTSKGVITGGGQLILPNIVPGNHAIEATMDGFKNFLATREFTAKGTVDVKLEPVVYSPEITDEFRDLVNWDAPAAWKPMADGKPGLRVSGPERGYRRDTIYKDFDMYMTISFNNDKGAVWIVRARDGSNYYLFQLTRKQFTGYLCKHGQISRIGAPQTIPRTLLPGAGEMFRVHVTAKGPDIRTFIKDRDGVEQPINVTTDSTLYDGKIGLGTFDGEEFTVHLLTVVPAGKGPGQ